MSWKKKGKCSKGDLCLFIHDEANRGTVSKVKNDDESVKDNNDNDTNNVGKISAATAAAATTTSGICNNFKKKGKCRKGDKCPYSHDVSPHSHASTAAEPHIGGKKRKITGKILVDARKARLNTMVKFDNND